MPVLDARMALSMVESNLESIQLPANDRSRPGSGRAETSASMPVLCAFGPLKTRRDEQLPASTVTCKSLISLWKAAALKVRPAFEYLTPAS